MSETDVAAIRKLIEGQFAALTWSQDRPPDWDGFERDFHPSATLFPSGRPAKPQSVPSFVDRMRELSKETLETFDEALRGAWIRVYGNVAVALAVIETQENDDAPTRGVEALLLIKEGDRWRVAAQAWDSERADCPIPPGLLD